MLLVLFALLRPRVWLGIVVANGMVMTFYVWNMTAAVLAAVILLPTGIAPQFEELSGAWWRGGSAGSQRARSASCRSCSRCGGPNGRMSDDSCHSCSDLPLVRYSCWMLQCCSRCMACSGGVRIADVRYSRIRRHESTAALAFRDLMPETGSIRLVRPELPHVTQCLGCGSSGIWD